MSFLSAFRSYFKCLTDAPEIYGRLAAYQAASLVIGETSWIPYATRRLKGNLWTCLVGPSTEVRKSTTVELIARIAQKRGVRFLKDISRERAFAKLEESPRLDFFTTEFAEFLNTWSREHHSGLSEALLEFYDSAPVHLSRETLKANVTYNEPFCSITSATTIEKLGESMPQNAVESGFFPRVLFVYVPERDSPTRPPGEASASREVWLSRMIPRVGLVRIAKGCYPVLERLEKTYKELENGLTNLSGITRRMSEQTTKIGLIEAVCARRNQILPNDLETAGEFLLDCSKTLRELDKGLIGSKFIKRVRLMSRLLGDRRMGASEIKKEFPALNNKEVGNILVYGFEMGIFEREPNVERNEEVWRNVETNKARTA